MGRGATSPSSRLCAALIQYQAPGKDGQRRQSERDLQYGFGKQPYLGVYEFDPTDADKEYLKYQNMIVRKSEDHVGEEAGQIKGNLVFAHGDR